MSHRPKKKASITFRSATTEQKRPPKKHAKWLWENMWLLPRGFPLLKVGFYDEEEIQKTSSKNQKTWSSSTFIVWHVRIFFVSKFLGEFKRKMGPNFGLVNLFRISKRIVSVTSKIIGNNTRRHFDGYLTRQNWFMLPYFFKKITILS